MNRLSTEQVLKDNKSRDPNSITSLSLTHKALSDVSCLTDFSNLERLDLSSNNLTSLEGLKHCVNLKWLSVVQNKLQSLKGVEGLSKLTVLNAGKNKLRSMDDVMSVVSLRALILNDNEIVSVCRLDHLKELNTLVLSRNPIREIGESLLKVKSITKLSLSNCQVQTIGSSLKSCTDLKELRLAHNDIKTLPAELAYNKRLQNLDLGNNLITKWSELKVLNSLVGLRNLNLQGNPVTEYDKLANKVRKLLPNLHIFNARPMNKSTKNEQEGIVDKIIDQSADEKIKVRKEKKGDRTRETSVVEKEVEKKVKERGMLDAIYDEKNSGGKIFSKDKDGPMYDSSDVDMKKDRKRKRKKINEKLSSKDIADDNDDQIVETKLKKKSIEKQGELDVIDDGETPFTELFSANIAGNNGFDGNNNMVNEGLQLKSVKPLVASSYKNKNSKNRNTGLAVPSSQEVEIGLGGPSAWGDE